MATKTTMDEMERDRFTQRDTEIRRHRRRRYGMRFIHNVNIHLISSHRAADTHTQLNKNFLLLSLVVVRVRPHLYTVVACIYLLLIFLFFFRRFRMAPKIMMLQVCAMNSRSDSDICGGVSAACVCVCVAYGIAN